MSLCEKSLLWLVLAYNDRLILSGLSYPSPMLQYPLRLLFLILMLFVSFAAFATTDDIPDPEHAFVFSARVLDNQHIAVHYQIAPGCYLYRDKFHFQLHDAALGTPQFPAGETKNDPNFGVETIYRHDVTVILPFSQDHGNTVQLDSTAQGCADAGICYSPIHQHSQLILNGPASPVASSGPLNAPAPFPAHLSEILATFFGAGLLLALTPCVFPMIPILSGIIVQQKTTSRGQSFLLSLAYVLGMALTYTMVGIAAALSGSLISNTLQNPWALGSAALLFSALALSMFGLYELQLPSAWQSKFAGISNRFHNGHLLGTFIMGALSALIIGPCVAPPLAAALTWIARTGNLITGGLALFSLALGMGVPLLLLGLGAGSLLPRAGVWMNGIKQFFGVAMLGVAIWIISPLLPVMWQMLLWASLLIVASVFWHTIDPLPDHVSAARRISKGFATILFAIGLAELAGALAGAQNLLQPLNWQQISVNTTASASNVRPIFKAVHNLTELDQALALAKGQPVMLDFYADWCVSCREMEASTLRNGSIRQQMNAFVLLRADVTANSVDDDALRQRFGIFGPPAIILFDRSGHAIQPYLIGLQSVADLATQLHHALLRP